MKKWDRNHVKLQDFIIFRWLKDKLVTLLTSSTYKHMKRKELLLICLSDKAKIAIFFKIIEFLFWFKTPLPSGKTEERKPDPRGN